MIGCEAEVRRKYCRTRCWVWVAGWLVPCFARCWEDNAALCNESCDGTSWLKGEGGMILLDGWQAKALSY